MTMGTGDANRVLVELVWGPSGRSYDLDVPGDVPARELAQLIAESLDPGATEPVVWALAEAASGETLPPDRGLAALGLWSGTRLICRSSGAKRHSYPVVAVLCTASGRQMRLEGGTLLLGRPRADGGSTPYPLIDLSQEPYGRTVSRSHALLRVAQGSWSIEHLSTAKHDTLINGRPIPTGREMPLRDGDEVQLGGLKLIFMSVTEQET